MLLNGCVIGGPPTKRNGASPSGRGCPALIFAMIRSVRSLPFLNRTLLLNVGLVAVEADEPDLVALLGLGRVEAGLGVVDHAEQLVQELALVDVAQGRVDVAGLGAVPLRAWPGPWRWAAPSSSCLAASASSLPQAGSGWPKATERPRMHRPGPRQRPLVARAPAWRAPPAPLPRRRRPTVLSWSPSFHRRSVREGGRRAPFAAAIASRGHGLSTFSWFAVPTLSLAGDMTTLSAAAAWRGRGAGRARRAGRCRPGGGGVAPRRGVWWGGGGGGGWGCSRRGGWGRRGS